MKTRVVTHVVLASLISIGFGMGWPGRALGNDSDSKRADQLKQEVLEKAPEKAMEIIQAYPPDNYFILNLGLTTAPIDAAMRQIIRNPQDQQLYFDGLPVKSLVSISKMTPEDQKRVFDRMVPSADALDGRMLLINRTLDEGRTMKEFIPLLMQYLSKHRPDVYVAFHFTGRLPMKEMGLGEVVKSATVPPRPPPMVTYNRDPKYVKAVVEGKKASELAVHEPFWVSAMTTPDFKLSPNGEYSLKTLSPYMGNRTAERLRFKSMDGTFTYGYTNAMEGVRARAENREEDKLIAMARERIVEDNIVHSALDHASTLMKQYPPDKFFVLNFGVPSTLTSAGLRGLLSDQDLRSKYYRELTIEGIKNLDDYTIEQRDAFWKKVLPTPEELGGRKMVLHRTSWEGKSSTVLVPDLARYMRKYRPDEEMGYYYVYFDKAAGRKLKRLFDEAEDVFSRGEIVEDGDYARTINLGEKLDKVAENQSVTVREVVNTDDFKFSSNEEAKRIDKRIADYIVENRRNVRMFQNIAAECAGILASMSTRSGKPAKPKK